MKASSIIIAFVLAYIAIAGGLWAASQWWEKGLATRLSAPRISPNGCYRVESFKPFWVLPNIAHPRPHPDKLENPEWFPWWEYPGFYRLYNHRNGEWLGESLIFDLESASGPLHWGSKAIPEVSAGMITIGPNTPDCIGDRPYRPEEHGPHRPEADDAGSKKGAWPVKGQALFIELAKTRD